MSALAESNVRRIVSHNVRSRAGVAFARDLHCREKVERDTTPLASHISGVFFDS